MPQPDISVSDFVDGLSLHYVGIRGKQCSATYRTGEGVYVEEADTDLGLVPVDDIGARRVYWNLVGGKKDET